MHVYGTSKRLFINSTLGCKSRCSYCYLPSLNYDINLSDLKVMGSKALIHEVENNTEFNPGKSGTIISLGCYSECWDEQVREDTLQLIEYFLQKKNPIQFATKRHVDFNHLKRVAPYISWKGQLCIFISSATITKWMTVERGTDAPEERFKSFKSAKKLDIPIYLYIKPVLKSVTINDLDKYLDLIEKHDINGVIVGKKFIKTDNSSNHDVAPISNGMLMYCNNNDDEYKLFKAFSSKINTYDESLQAVEFWRNYA